MDKKILLVDDDISVRNSICRLLQTEGFQVISAANGAEALKIVEKEPVDIVLLDLNLPIKNGWETFQHLSSGHPLIPVIIITARSNQLFPALAAGVGALMEKPLEFPKLLRAIRELIAEPQEVRLARNAGKKSEFHYLPAHSES